MSDETTSNAAHTPGPWSASHWENGSHEGDYIEGYQLTAGGHLLPLCSMTGDIEEAEANARLAAAAPELLEALRGLHHMCELALAGKNGVQHSNMETRLGTFVHAEPLMKAAEAAIAIATGAHHV